MNHALTDDVYAQLEGAPLHQMAQQLGIGPAQMAGALSAALPLLLGALGRNASEPQGAEALFGALQKDHAELDPGDVLSAVLGGGQANGGKILGHVFGGRQPRAETTLGQATGLGGDRAAMLLKMLAPVVLAYLAKRMFQRRPAGSATPQVLGEELGHEHQRVSQQGGLGGGVLGAVLDQDGDGQLGLGDLLRIGEGMLGARH